MANSKKTDTYPTLYLQFVKEDKSIVFYDDATWTKSESPYTVYSVKVLEDFKEKTYSIILANGQKDYQLRVKGINKSVKKARKAHKEIEAHFGI